MVNVNRAQTPPKPPKAGQPVAGAGLISDILAHMFIGDGDDGRPSTPRRSKLFAQGGKGGLHGSASAWGMGPRVTVRALAARECITRTTNIGPHGRVFPPRPSNEEPSMLRLPSTPLPLPPRWGGHHFPVAAKTDANNEENGPA